jgi:hypothetical protein
MIRKGSTITFRGYKYCQEMKVATQLRTNYRGCLMKNAPRYEEFMRRIEKDSKKFRLISRSLFDSMRWKLFIKVI